MNGNSAPVFREEQKFKAWLRWLVYLSMGLAACISILALRKEFAGQNPPGTQEAILAIIGGIAVPVLVAALFFLLGLETEVRSDGVYVRFVPFHIRFKRFVPGDLSKYYARQYKPIREYGGWGIRCSLRNGKAYSTSGDRGVQLVFKSGKQLLIGSQKAEELEQAIRSIMGKQDPQYYPCAEDNPTSPIE
ncbi:MAG: hypothetical protein AMJ65_04030 [Phycisphaerae bacterium SG8_4]|nr:MAG: hypothetical protein AMJ65_04030 [Phycisphaerae bacterium SG8_4]